MEDVTLSAHNLASLLSSPSSDLNITTPSSEDMPCVDIDRPWAHAHVLSTILGQQKQKVRSLVQGTEGSHTASFPISESIATLSTDTIASWREIIVTQLDARFKCNPKKGNWENHVKIYPHAVRYIQEFFEFLPITSHGDMERRWQGFYSHIREWATWSVVETLIHHSEIRATVLSMMMYARSIFQVLTRDWKFDLASCYLSKWRPRLLRETLADDYDHMSQVISLEQENILYLPAEELFVLMDLIQALIDQQCSNHRVLERFLKKVVKTTGLLPPYLFLSDIRRIDTNPVTGGGFADIWRGVVRGRVVALKVLRIFGDTRACNAVHQDLCKETMIWRQFNHENILPFYGICRDVFSPRIAMVSPWMINGDMRTFLRRNIYADRRKLVWEVALGLCYLHTLKPQVVHGDIRAGNVMIDDRHTPRIADFGLSKIIDSQAGSLGTTSFDGKGSLRWWAPELLKTSQSDSASINITSMSDVYAFAFLCLEVFTGEIPFRNLTDANVIMAIAIYGNRPSRPGEPAIQLGLDNSMWAIMQECWTSDPTKRPDSRELAHRLMPYLAGDGNARQTHDLLRTNLTRNGRHHEFLMTTLDDQSHDSIADSKTCDDVVIPKLSVRKLNRSSKDMTRRRVAGKTSLMQAVPQSYISDLEQGINSLSGDTAGPSHHNSSLLFLDAGQSITPFDGQAVVYRPKATSGSNSRDSMTMPSSYSQTTSTPFRMSDDLAIRRSSFQYTTPIPRGPTTRPPLPPFIQPSASPEYQFRDQLASYLSMLSERRGNSPTADNMVSRHVVQTNTGRPTVTHTAEPEIAPPEWNENFSSPYDDSPFPDSLNTPAQASTSVYEKLSSSDDLLLFPVLPEW